MGKKEKSDIRAFKRWQAWPFVDRYIGPVSDEAAIEQEIDELQKYLTELLLELDSTRRRITKLQSDLKQLRDSQIALLRARGF